MVLVSLVDCDSTLWVVLDGDWDLRRHQQVEGGPSTQMKVIELVFLVDRDSTLWVTLDGDWDLQWRWWVEGGPSIADEGDYDLFEKKRVWVLKKKKMEKEK